MGVDDHRRRAPDSVRTAILTVSDTRTPTTDSSGRLARELVEGAGHRVVRCDIVRDEPDQIRSHIRGLLDTTGIEAILITGGTGLSPRDTTVEVLGPILEKRIEGFGELFRSLSFEQIGAAAMLSRAVAGVCRGRVVVAMPGSEPAVRLALTRLILPELGHMVWLAGGADRLT